MKLPARVTAQQLEEVIPENRRDDYVPIEGVDGWFQLDVDPVEGFTLHNPDKLQKALGDERAKRERAEQGRKAWMEPFAELLDGDGDPDPTLAVQRWRDMQSQLAASGEKLDPSELDARMEEERRRWSAQVSEKDATIARLADEARTDFRRRQIERVLAEDAALEEDKRLRLRPEAIPVLTQHLAPRIKVTGEPGAFKMRLEDEDGTPLYATTGSDPTRPRSLREHLEAMRTDPSSSFFFTPKNTGSFNPSNDGSGGPGSGTPLSENPWITGNRTKQMEATRDLTPAEVNRLKSQAARHFAKS